MYSFYHDISTLSQNNLATALADSAVSHVSSTAVQSSINGDSFSEALESQGSNILIGAVGNLGAQEIGSAFKSGNISRAKQLTLHSALGCGTALAGGGDCASGALSGVSGELAGEYVKDTLYPGQTPSSLTGQQKTVIKELGGLAGGLSAIFTGNAVGLSDGEVADNIFSGQRIGKNAAENNALANIGGAIAGGAIGGVGAGVSAIIGGEKDIKNIGKAVLIGSGIGAASGAIFSPAGVMKGITIGGLIGATGGGLEGYVTELSTNNNATNYDLLNSSLKGALSGAVGGSVAGAFGGAIGSSVGISGGYAAGMMGLGAGVSTSAINTKYNFFEPRLNSSKIQTNNKPIN